MLKRMMGHSMIIFLCLLLISWRVNMRVFGFHEIFIGPLQVICSACLLALACRISGLAVRFRRAHPEALTVVLVFWVMLAANLLLLFVADEAVLPLVCLSPWWGLLVNEVLMIGLGGSCAAWVILASVMHYSMRKRRDGA